MSREPALLGSSFRARVAHRASDPLLRSAYSLMLNVALTSVLGLGFWIIAAQLFPSQVVGRDSALVAAMVTISVICMLNLQSGILRFLPITKLSPSRVVLGAYATTALASAVGGTLFVLIAPRVAHEYRFLEHDTSLSALYVAAVTVWGVFALQDAVLISLRRAPWVPLENATFGVMKAAALPVLLAAGTLHAVFVAWVIPVVMLVVPVNFLIFTRLIPNRPQTHSELSPIERFGWRGLTAFMVQDYLGTIFFQAAVTQLPVIVVALLGPSQGAYFYMPFTIVAAFDLLFLNVASSLTVEASIAGGHLAALARTTVLHFRYVLASGMIVLVAGASFVLLPFGPAYADAGAPVLRLLACASAFRAVIALYCTICRVEGKAHRVLIIQAAVFVTTMSLTILLGRSDGIQGVALAWLIANLLVACAALPRVIRVLRKRAENSGPGAHRPAVTPSHGMP